MKDPGFFQIFTPISYWILVFLWSLILVLYLAHLKNRRAHGAVIATLLTVLAIDAFRTFFESLYFGLYFNSKFGILPEWIFSLLSQPHYIFIPKFMNVVAGIAVLIILIRRWLPRQLADERRSRRMLVESESRFRAITQSTHDAIVAVNEDSQVTFWNRGAETLFGYLCDEIIGRPVSLLIPQSSKGASEDGPPHGNGWGLERTRRQEEGFPAPNMESLGLKKNGEVFPVEVSLGIWSEGNQRYFSIVIRDITQRKEAERIQLEKQEAEAANRAKSLFLATMSHEIRTPINAILGMGELLLDTNLNQQQRNYLERSHHAGESLLALVNDILDLSRVEAGELVLESVHFDLNNLLESTADLLDLMAREKGIDLIREWPNLPSTWVRGDPGRLRQVVINLLNNAIKFTGQGKVCLQVVGDEEGLHTFSVIDSGIGIPPEKLETIFQPFTQVDASMTRQYGGTGLGLTICSRLVEAMGGRMQAESRVGEGSTFSFTLRLPPVAVGEVESVPKESIPQERRSAPKLGSVAARSHSQYGGISNGPGLRILLADDAEDNRLLIEVFLRKSPHTVESVSNGEEAVTRFMQESFDLVLMDLQMPVMDGLQATRRIRGWESDQGSPITPIIALTAHAFQDMEREALEAGCTLHLAKPIRKNRLLEVIDNLAKGF
ncbi:MAG: PAS domain S-box protein [Magnetococcales bacterium]|nr:PAS domain S-box protein [Magnetococcales bacterium]